MLSRSESNTGSSVFCSVETINGDPDSCFPLACRQREDCTAWFWCKDAEGRPCFDLQSRSWVNWHGCKLMDVPLLPADAPDPADMKPTSDAAFFRNYATGYTKSAPLPVACPLPSLARPAHVVSSSTACSSLGMLPADHLPRSQPFLHIRA